MGVGQGRTRLAPSPGPSDWLGESHRANPSRLWPCWLKDTCLVISAGPPWTEPLKFGAVPIYYGQVPSDPAPIPGHFLTMVSSTQISGRRVRNIRSSEHLAGAPLLSCPCAGGRGAGSASLTGLVPGTDNVGSTCVRVGGCTCLCVHRHACTCVCMHSVCSELGSGGCTAGPGRPARERPPPSGRRRLLRASYRGR